MSLVYAFLGKPSYNDIHLNLIESFFTTLTFNVLFPVRVHCFKSMRWWSNGSWCKRSDQPTEYTERYLNIRYNKMRESTVSDTFCTVNSLMNHATHCQWFRIAIIITKRWIFPIDRFNNWFTRWNKTLVICVISPFRQPAHFLYLFRMSRQEYFIIAYLLNYIDVDCYQMYA